jgi:hypothetical protein
VSIVVGMGFAEEVGEGPEQESDAEGDDEGEGIEG